MKPAGDTVLHGSLLLWSKMEDWGPLLTFFLFYQVMVAYWSPV